MTIIIIATRVCRSSLLEKLLAELAELAAEDDEDEDDHLLLRSDPLPRRPRPLSRRVHSP